MATDKSITVELTTLERAYVRKALDLLDASIKRSIVKELPGSEVARFREDERRAIAGISSKLGS